MVIYHYVKRVVSRGVGVQLTMFSSDIESVHGLQLTSSSYSPINVDSNSDRHTDAVCRAFSCSMRASAQRTRQSVEMKLVL